MSAASAAYASQVRRRANRWKISLLLAFLFAGILLLLFVDNLLVSALLAFVISYSLGPVVSRVERRLGMSRTLATTLVFAAVGALLALVAFAAAPYFGETISGLQDDMPRYITGVGEFIREIETRLRSVGGPFSRIGFESQAEAHLTSWTQGFFAAFPMYLQTALTVLLLGPFLAFFMIKDGRPALRIVLNLVPNPLFETALSLQHQINVQMGQFVRARLLESLIVAMVTMAGLLLIGFPYAIILGLVAGLTNLIPYLGPVLGAAPALAIAFANGLAPLAVVGMALVYVVAQLIDAGLLIPVLVAKIVDLHPVTVIVVIIAGAQVMGILGMIISIPVATTLKVTVSTIYRHLIDTQA